MNLLYDAANLLVDPQATFLKVAKTENEGGTVVMLVHVRRGVVIVIQLDARAPEIAAVGLVVQVGFRELGAQLNDVWWDTRLPARRHFREVRRQRRDGQLSRG